MPLVIYKPLWIVKADDSVVGANSCVGSWGKGGGGRQAGGAIPPYCCHGSCWLYPL